MIKIIFSDIDGTLAHYPEHFAKHGKIIKETKNYAIYQDKISGILRKCNILKSKTSGNAYISLKTIELIKKLREKSVTFVLISGARKSTFLSRLPLLPKADIEIAENGGRIYENKILDIAWSKKFEKITGNIETSLPPEQRKGKLWDLYRKLTIENWKIDTRDYYANFRIKLKNSPSKTEKDLQNIIKNLPANITCSFNLGKADFYPSISGKGNAAKYILKKYKIKKKEAVCLIDDDNDLSLTNISGTTMLPGIRNKNVQKAIQKHPDWIISKQKSILGIEELLEKMLKNVK